MSRLETLEFLRTQYFYKDTFEKLCYVVIDRITGEIREFTSIQLKDKRHVDQYKMRPEQLLDADQIKTQLNEIELANPQYTDQDLTDRIEHNNIIHIDRMRYHLNKQIFVNKHISASNGVITMIDYYSEILMMYNYTDGRRIFGMSRNDPVDNTNYRVKELNKKNLNMFVIFGVGIICGVFLSLITNVLISVCI